MLTEKLTYEDIVTKTVEALLGAGLKGRSIQNSYCKYYDMLGKYLDACGIRHYDIGVIEEFLQRNEERYRKKEINKRNYCAMKRAIRILIEYVEGDVIVSPEIRHVSKFTLNPLFEEIISGYLADNTFHPNTKDDIVWAIKRFLYYLEQIGHTTMHCV